MLIFIRCRRRLAPDQGFTLVETLVAIVTGVIVTGALFAILEVSLHQSARAIDVVQATQLGRTSMTKMINGLHSACFAQDFAPIQANSNENELIYVNAYTNKTIVPTASESATEGAYKRQIIYDKEKGLLTEKSYPSTGGTWPHFTYSVTASPVKGVRLGENITQTETGGKKVPIFRYYAYATGSSSSGETGVGSFETTPLTVPLSEELAEKAASVLISFKAASANNDSRLNRSVEFSNQVTLAFSAPNSEAQIEAGPCE